MNTRITSVNFIVTVMAMFCVNTGFLNQREVWKGTESGFNDAHVLSLVAHPSVPGLIFAGTKDGLYISRDAGKTFQPIYFLQGGQGVFNDIHIPTEDPDHVYAITTSAAYHSLDLGESWQRIFKTSSGEDQRLLTIYSDKDNIYLGTSRGLYVRTKDSSSWVKSSVIPERESVNQILELSPSLFLLTRQSVWRMNTETGEFKEIFSHGLGVEQESSSGVIGELSVHKEDSIRYGVVEKVGTKHVLLIFTQSGLYHSFDLGESWRVLGVRQVPFSDISSLITFQVKNADLSACERNLFNCIHLMIGSHKGVFLLENGTGRPIVKGMMTNQVECLVKDANKNVFAATDRGVYRLPVERTLPSDNYSEVSQTPYTRAVKSLEHEPTINDVHGLAIDYAEVHPSKIQEWRRLAKVKALLPRLSAGLDRAATDLYHWDTGQSPDNLQKGDEYLDWDISLSWDLSDLIWSTDQTSIDSRSKLMVELREDIINQVTRLYFERRRLQVELLAVEELGEMERVDKEMRVAELTALIDGLTGGEFSRRLSENAR